MKTELASNTDYDSWLNLALEIEPLFGTMVEEKSFQNAFKQSIFNKSAFCIHTSEDAEQIPKLVGGIMISKEDNEIIWFAVSKKYRSKGYGTSLLCYAISQLDTVEFLFILT